MILLIDLPKSRDQLVCPARAASLYAPTPIKLGETGKLRLTLQLVRTSPPCTSLPCTSPPCTSRLRTIHLRTIHKVSSQAFTLTTPEARCLIKTAVQGRQSGVQRNKWVCKSGFQPCAREVKGKNGLLRQGSERLGRKA